MRLLIASLALSLSASCANTKEHVKVVQVDEYGDIQACWTGSDGAFEAFLVVHSEDGLNYPYFVSIHCDLQLSGFPEGIGFLGFMKAVPLRDDSKLLSELFNGSLIFEPTNHSATPVAKLDSEIFVFKGYLEQSRYGLAVSYSVSEVSNFKRTEMTLGDLKNLNPTQRRDLWIDHSQRRP